MHWRRRACQIVDFIHFGMVWIRDVMPDKLKMFMLKERAKGHLLTRKEVVYANDVVAHLQEALAQMESQKTGPARHENAFEWTYMLHGVHDPITIQVKDENIYGKVHIVLYLSIVVFDRAIWSSKKERFAHSSAARYSFQYSGCCASMC